MRSLFIVTSALKPKIGAYSFLERYEQTIACLDCLLYRVPNATIMVCDMSLSENSFSELEQVRKRCHFFMDLSNDDDMKKLSSAGLKSHAETLMLHKALIFVKNNLVLSEYDRIFKMSCRSMLTDEFNINAHEKKGKYVFAKRVPTWMSPPILDASYSLTTRFYSMCVSLVDDYMEILIKNFNSFNSGLDAEHAHFVNMNKEYLIELDTLGGYGFVAGHGKIEYY
jgi:hypothetical protein